MRFTSDQFEELISHGYTIAKIATELKIGDTTVRYYLKKFGLKTKQFKHDKFSDETLLEVWNRSRSLTQFLLNLGVNVYGGSYYHYRTRLSKLGIDFDNLKGLGGKIAGTLANSKALLKPNRARRSSLVKLLKDNNVPVICNRCSIDSWMGIKLKLEIHHKDENPKNNKIENLEYLCPNCHSIHHHPD